MRGATINRVIALLLALVLSVVAKEPAQETVYADSPDIVITQDGSVVNSHMTLYRAGFQTNICSNGAMVLNATVTSTATFMFNEIPARFDPSFMKGSTVQVNFVAADTAGYVDVYLDGPLWTSYNTYGKYVVPGTCTIDQLVSGTLTPGPHNLTIINSDPTVRTHLYSIQYTPLPRRSNSKGAIAGGVIGSLVILAAIVALAFYLKRRRSRTISAPEPFDLDAYDASQVTYVHSSSRYQSVSLHDYTVGPYLPNPFPLDLASRTAGITPSVYQTSGRADGQSQGSSSFGSDGKPQLRLSMDSFGTRRSTVYTQDQIIAQGAWVPDTCNPNRISGDAAPGSATGGWREVGGNGNVVIRAVENPPPAYGNDKAGVKRWSSGSSSR
ncbi:hypothetical protein FRB97_008002 [Tulasnella sp. 331]|nr:hypothetical protein FRB97_008002 [Tulasnella sp. 331]